jgi:GAF domain-containing protein
MNRTAESAAAREALVTRTFLELADTLVADFDIIDSLTVLADRCVEILDIDATGILLADAGGLLRVIAASSEQARLIELFQLQNDEGPCTEAFSSGVPVIDLDLHDASERWPRFTPYAIAAGFGSVYAIPLRLRGNIIGALNLFGSGPGALTGPDLVLAQALADLASIAILQAQAATEARRRDEQLQHALDGRIIIEQAKGMLAEHAGIDVAAAFDLIRARSRTTNVKLTDVAHHMVSGRLGLDDLVADRARRR